MKSIVRHLGSISGSRLKVAGGALGILVLLGLIKIGSAQEPDFSVLYTFTGPDGSGPYAGLIVDAAGNFYGTTMGGGAYGYGVVFKLGPAGKEKVLHCFTGGADGRYPYAGPLLRDAAGNLYGTTSSGGAHTYGGVVFKLDPAGKLTVLHSFTGGPDGSNPLDGLIADGAGNLYGTTQAGGNTSACDGGCGVVFKLDAAGEETVLYTFTGGADGKYPYPGLVRDAEGNLYGTTSWGGDTSVCQPVGCGVVFKVDAAGKETVLHRFHGPDGEEPLWAPLLRDRAGNLYGMTFQGGNSTECSDSPYAGCGVVFKLDRAGRETVLHSFSYHEDGGYPGAGLFRSPSGRLYGTTTGGGAYGDGNVFKLDRAGNMTVLYSFTGGADGAGPSGRLLWYKGSLYGTASAGGTTGAGVVFKLQP